MRIAKLLICNAALLALLVVPATGLAEPVPDAPAMPAAADGVTSIGFEQTVLDDLGIEVEIESTSPPVISGQLGFAQQAGSNLAFAAPGGDFEGFSHGVLRHHGGLTLHIGGVALDLRDFELRVAADPLELELFDAAGARWLLFQNPMALVANGLLRLNNVDVNIAPELAAVLGRPDLAGSYLGQADLVIPEPIGLVAPLGAGQCDDVFVADRDVSLVDIGTVSQIARKRRGPVALSFSARLRNSGTSAILWKRSIEPDGPPEEIGEHPFLALHVYRILDGKIEQIGRADIKHAFYSTNIDCPCSGGHTIYPGCEDIYGSNTNSNRQYFAHREEVSVGTGAWSRVGSHFDATPVDDFRDHGGNSAHDSFEHRLLVDESDLETGGSYFVEAWYIISGDVDIWNSMGHDAVSPSFSGNTWSFSTTSSLQSGPILEEFVDPVAPPPGSANDVLDTGEGRLQLAVATTDLGGGQVRYEYALMNFDFDRQIRSFSVPLEAGITIANPDFGDTDVDAGNDWTVDVGTTAITWVSPAGNEMDWGTLYRFGFEADRSAVDTSVSLAALEPGQPSTLGFQTLGPAPIAAVPAPGLAFHGLMLLGLALAGVVIGLARR
jgi:hypothetical protein